MVGCCYSWTGKAVETITKSNHWRLNMRNVLWHARQFSAFFLAIVGATLLIKGNEVNTNLGLYFIGAALCALGLTFLWSTRSKE
jgi:hypothetical protein